MAHRSQLPVSGERGLITMLANAKHFVFFLFFAFFVLFEIGSRSVAQVSLGRFKLRAILLPQPPQVLRLKT